MFLLKLKEENRNKPISFWVDSSGGPKEYCNLSFCGSDPKYYLYGSLDEICLQECDTGAISFVIKNCFNFLEDKINEEKHNKDGVFVGYITYDLFSCRSTINRTSTYPDFFFAYFPTANNSHNEIASSALSEPPRDDVPLRSNMTDSEYLEKVKLIKEEIKAGNVYQVNLTREYSLVETPRWGVSTNRDELDLYLKLRSTSPNPYSCFFKTPFVSILSSSPEEFLYIKDGYIRTRPIKGTLLKNVFEIDPKNQAENIMIVDLERNDLGKICKYGSIKADRLLEIESYKHLNHVVSTIEGELREDVRLRDIFSAMFPGGSITGAPKIAAMKLINKLEPTKRGAYTGTFGYIKTDGTINFNILIRTIFIKDNKITFNIGGGIVADSTPEDELEECKIKAKGIMNTLGLC